MLLLNNGTRKLNAEVIASRI